MEPVASKGNMHIMHMMDTGEGMLIYKYKGVERDPGVVGRAFQDHGRISVQISGKKTTQAVQNYLVSFCPA